MFPLSIDPSELVNANVDLFCIAQKESNYCLHYIVTLVDFYVIATT